MYLQLAVSEWATNSVLVREEERIQRPTYYTSKPLLDAKTRYPKMGKWAIALVTDASKMRPYLQAYPIILMMDQSLQLTLYKPEASGSLV